MKLPIILGTKAETKRVFTEAGKQIPVTFVKTAPTYLLNIEQKEGESIVLVGHGTKKRIPKPVRGKLEKLGVKEGVAHMRQVRTADTYMFDAENAKKITFGEEYLEVGTIVHPTTVFSVGDAITVVATSKGKGFQGVVKRHGFAGGPKTHGQSDRERAPGSIGQRMTPGRVFKGMKMAGRMGGDRVTIKGLTIHAVTEEGVYVTGLIPGSKTGLVEIHKA